MAPEWLQDVGQPRPMGKQGKRKSATDHVYLPSDP
jgi:hypothetical protein